MADLIISEMFEGTGIVLQGMTDTFQLFYVSQFSQYGLTELTYSFTGNNGFYSIDESNILRSLVAPSLMDYVYLNINMKFSQNPNIVIVRRIPISLILGQGEGTSDRFYAFYVYLNNLLSERTYGYYTYKTFEMPLSYGSTVFFDYTVTVSLKEDNSLVSGVLVLSNVDSSKMFSISIPSIPMSDLNVKVEYYYDFGQGMELYGVVSNFTIPGVIHQNVQGIPDTQLYNAILNAFGNVQDSVILTSQLSAEKQTFGFHSTATSFKGIEYLINVQVFDFSNSNFGANTANFSYLSNLGRLVELNLSGNSLTSIDDMPVISNLRILDLYNNNISWFWRLLELPDLQSVYLYENIGQTNLGSIGTYYPATATYINYNDDTFIQLRERGVFIYNTISNSVPVLYSYTIAQRTVSRALHSLVLLVKFPSSETSFGSYQPQRIRVAGTDFTPTYVSNTSPRYFLIRLTIGGQTLYRRVNVITV